MTSFYLQHINIRGMPKSKLLNFQIEK